MTRIERVKREVIEDALLASLDDGDKVAIVLNRKDLALIAFSLLKAQSYGADTSTFLDDIRKLGTARFGSDPLEDYDDDED